MSFGEKWREFWGQTPERHAIRDNDYWGRWASGEERGPSVHAGVEVSQTSALQLAVVYRCIQLIAGTLAALPADAVRKRDEIREPVPRPPAWIDYPNPEATWFEFAERVFESLAMDGNAFILITSRYRTNEDFGYPAEMWTLNPRDITVRKRNGRVEFVWEGSTVLQRFSPANPMGDVLHIKLSSAGGLRGISPIMAARQAIGLGLVGEKFGARFFGHGQQMSGVIQLPAEQPAKSREHIELMRQTWESAHAGSDKAHRPGILTGGATWQGISVTPEEAQFLESRSFQVEEIASRIYGIPPHMVGLTQKSTSYGEGIEQQSLGFVRFTLMPWIVRFESAMSQLLPRGQFLRLNQRGLLRADSETESRVLAQQLEHGVINFDRWRELMDLPPRPGGDRYMVPGNMTLLDTTGGDGENGEAMSLLDLTLALQKIYLAVGVVITPEEAREILNRGGAGLGAAPAGALVPSSDPNGQRPRTAEPPPSPNGNGRVTVPTGG